ILIVEDDIKLRNELSIFLNNNGYEVESITNFSSVVEDIIKINPSLILLDINLPGVDGEYICKNLRKVSDIPVVILTSRNNEIDEVISIKYGADDFITKPYNPQILLARIERIIKRNTSGNHIIVYKGIKLDTSKSTFSYNDKTYDLSKNEIRILSFMIKNNSRIVSRDELMNYLWDNDSFIDDNALNVNINRVRIKLNDAGLVNAIETKRGQGYILK
ncbi:MAG: response regulator transcription factor, partial [Bacilli bacterium]